MKKTMFWPDNVRAKLSQRKLVAVLVIEELKHALPTAEALLRGGVDIVELTFRTPVARDALRAIRNGLPEMTVGAGTILTTKDCEAARGAGAAFAVAPGFNPDVVRCAADCGLPFAPGVATPSEIEAAYGLGCDILKLFPAEPLGGLPYLSSMYAPYKHLNLQFIPLGGVNAGNFTNWLGNSAVIAVGGSWIAHKELIEHEQWDSIQKNAAESRKLCDALNTRRDT